MRIYHLKDLLELFILVRSLTEKVRTKIRVRFSVTDDFSVQLKDVQYKMKIEDAQFNIESFIVKSDDSESGDGANRVILKQVCFCQTFDKGILNEVIQYLLNQIANTFINADPKFILRKIEPRLEHHFTEYLTKTIKSLLHNVKLQDFVREK